MGFKETPPQEGDEHNEAESTSEGLERQIEELEVELREVMRERIDTEGKTSTYFRKHLTDAERGAVQALLQKENKLRSKIDELRKQRDSLSQDNE
jgi:predicted  nucleic acid-binding Zn-ribbon protein